MTRWQKLSCGILVLVLNNAPGSAQGSQNKSVSTRVDVQPSQLLSSPVSANWLSYNGDYTGRRFSALREINPSNVSQLRAQWVFHVSNSDRLEVTPVVVDGIMFVTSANDAYALDAQTGQMLWHYSRPITEGLIDDASQHHNRGVGIWHTRIYMETDNAHLLCLDARSGHLLWDVAYTDGNKNYGATSAPLVVNDKVLVGTSAATTVYADLLRHTTPKQEKKRGVSGRYPAPENLVLQAGPVKRGNMAAAQPGCPERSIQN